MPLISNVKMSVNPLPSSSANEAVVEVQVDATGEHLPQKATIVAWAENTLRHLQQGAVEVCVRVVDAEESQRFNRDFRGVDKPTNVLSFELGMDLPVPMMEPRPLGDLVICLPVVVSEAQAQGKSVHDHFAHMVVHGVLHLSGFDHETEVEAEAMERLEREVLAGMNIGDPYR